MFGKKKGPKSNLPLRVRLVRGLIRVLKAVLVFVAIVVAVVVVWAILASTGVVPYSPLDIWRIVTGFLGTPGSLATIAGTLIGLVFLFWLIDDEIDRF